ncbi:hypothetical protein C2G38_2170733 [Gigaspora rosea]|uniref:Uncharacterized protein n=1 Tax=Gigaspora rosea TaxID=44941 RepID=A0A397VME1_9GLOM|nr:hypothetical protein C2G38_2170733 [Gigaspora rosea]
MSKLTFVAYVATKFKPNTEDLTRLLEIKPDNMIALRYKSEITYMMKDNASEDLTRLLEIESDNMITLRYRNDTSEDLTRLLEIEPDNTIALRYRNDASEDLTRLLEIESDNTIALRSEINYKMKRYNESIANLEKLLYFKLLNR